MSLPLAVGWAEKQRHHQVVKTTQNNKHQSRENFFFLFPTFEKPVSVPLFGAVGLQEGENILGDVFHNSCGKSGIFQMRNVLCFNHFVFLGENNKNLKNHKVWFQITKQNPHNRSTVKICKRKKTWRLASLCCSSTVCMLFF